VVILSKQLVVANNDAELTGFQFALKYELASQSISSALVESPLLGSWGAGNYNISNDSVVRVSWFSVTPYDFNQGDTLVSIRFANPDASLNTCVDRFVNNGGRVFESIRLL
jgi:hypothetical protein